jgi:hypothetical protein
VAAWRAPDDVGRRFADGGHFLFTAAASKAEQLLVHYGLLPC